MHTLEIREVQGNKLVCLVNNYDYSKIMTDKQGKKFRERISKEVWEQAIEKNKDNIKIFLNHQDYIEIGSNIEVQATNEGVILTLELSDKEMGLYNAAKQDKLTGCSFGFKCIKDNITENQGYYDREILEMELKEISLLDKTPAYNNTSVEARDLKYKNSLLKKEIELLSLR